MFSYEHLKSFCATYDENSYSGAARLLGKDRTTIREQIKALEDSYHVMLFSIEGKKAVPTEFARSIYKQAQLLVRNSERLDVRMLQAYQQPLSSIDFYHDTLMPNDLVIQIEAFVIQHHPHVILNWLHRNRDEILQEVANGHNQIAIMQHRMESFSEYPIAAIKLGDGDFAAYARVGSPLFDLDVVQLEDLQLEAQYISENQTKTMPEWLGISPYYRTVSNNDMLLDLVKHHGWALLPCNLAEEAVESQQIRRIELKELTRTAKFGLSFFYPLSFEATDVYKGLVEVIKRYSKKHL
ncbi:LysR family transcriptional regulator [Vibrio scophthalmi]|uniref:Transcriptional regulator, LysR family protein n=1 Tax=Vibrio scophthalmi LMG 19158 TaxID=870967 RepID=F9RP94_9VIBR|nr:LysR family transcriptional regulator [Vibrio scophthalmi]EGU35604.1 Transcriptional regulator, LysR family protein [Vibrio scophthalmi LMG 19158]